MRFRLLLCAVAALVLACAPAHAESVWSQFSQQFLDAYFANHPVARLNQDGPTTRGPDQPCSVAFLQQEMAWWQTQLRLARQFSPADLSPAERFDRRRLLHFGEGQLFVLERSARYSIEPWFEELDPQRWLDTLQGPAHNRQGQPNSSIPIYLRFLKGQAACANALQTTLLLPLSEAEKEWAHTLLSYYHSATMFDAPKAYAGYSRAERRQLGEASKQAGDALLRLDNAIQQRSAAEPLQRLGERDLLAYLQQREGMTVSLATLQAIADNGQQRLQQSLATLCQHYAPDQPVPQCIEHAREERPTAGVIELADELIRRARQTIEQHQLMSLPAGAHASVGKGMSFRRDWLVYLQQPGLFSKHLDVQVLVTAPAMDWSETERREHWRHRTSMPVTVAHEVWPGHYLQTLHALQQPSPLAVVLRWPSHHEGWASYSESLLFQHADGYADIGSQIIQRQLELVRVARLQVLLGLHGQDWSRAQAEQRFRDVAWLSPASASQEALRSAVSPPAGMYFLGAWYITRLRTAWLAAQRSDASWKTFHDQFLAYGNAPLPMIAAEMLGEDAAAALWTD